MYRQFGAHPDNAHDKKTVQNFRIKVLRELKKIKLAWPELNYSTAPGGLDPASLDPGHRPSGSVSTSKLEPQGSPLTAPPLKVVPGASYGVLLDRRHEVHPQFPVIEVVYPRAFGSQPFRTFGSPRPQNLRAFGSPLK